MNQISIWEPRYRDNTVLIAQYKVEDHNLIVFTRAKHLAGREFYLSGNAIRECPLETNGKINCYAVPLDALIPLEKAA